VLSARALTHNLARLSIWRSRPVLLLVLAAVTIVLGVSDLEAAQLSLTWIDTSGGQAAFSIERRTGSTGTYAEVAQQQVGVASYTDTSVAAGTTYCYRVRAFDAAATSSYSNEACASPAGGLALAIVKAGTGSGTVGSTPAGINCGTACSATYSSGTVATLSATPAAGAIFSGWSGAGCSGTDPCTLAGNGSVVVSATFAATTATTTTTTATSKLTVSKRGVGTVSSSPGGISCGSVCSASYVRGTTITLTAVPGAGNVFVGWKGSGCSGTSPCTVTVSGNISVLATFSTAK
jgi:List-Bact-rpt repeat protein